MTQTRDTKSACPVFILSPLFFFPIVLFLSSNLHPFGKPLILISVPFLTETVNKNQLTLAAQGLEPGIFVLCVLDELIFIHSFSQERN